jgi:DNA-binding GntR family transcriptional regulator
MDAINTPTYIRLREQLRADIVAGIWPLGGHVTLAQLSAHYQVSANPVREALLQLQGEGVVAMRMNRGAVVPMVDAKYIDNLCRVRGAIQAMTIREAARCATPDQVKQIKVLAEQYEAAVQTGDAGTCVQANRALHRAIDGIADNTMALELLDGRSSLMDAFRRQVGYRQGRLDLVVAQHRKLVKAIASGNEEAAVRASIEHTDSARLDLLAAHKSLPT